MRRGIFISIGVIAALAIFLGLYNPGEAESREIVRAPEASEKVVILELFTSQGCSSCPPAESVLSKIARDKKYATSVIPLAYHVDYWDYLGWKDPFASGKWTERQADYREAFGGATLYTPQIVIQGSYEMVGSNETRIKKQINQLLSEEASAGFNVSIEESSLIESPATEATQPSTTLALDVQASREAVSEGEILMLVTAVYENVAATDVKAGENAGRTLRNNYVVRSLEMKPLLFGDDETEKQIQVSLLLDESWRLDHLGVASWIQDPTTMKIYDAAALNDMAP